jgi:hypothetical protein
METVRSLTVIGVVAIVALFAWLARRRMASASLALAPHETRLGEMWGTSRDVTFGGLVLAGDATTGKLVLTSDRLLWVRLDERKIALALHRGDIDKVDVVKKSLAVQYRVPGKKKPKTLTVARIDGASGPGFTQSFEAVKNAPLDGFAASIESWRAG